MQASTCTAPCCRERPPAAASLLRFAVVRGFALGHGRFCFDDSSAVFGSFCACLGSPCCAVLDGDSVSWRATCAATRRTHAPRLASEPAARMPSWHGRRGHCSSNFCNDT